MHLLIDLHCWCSSLSFFFFLTLREYFYLLLLQLNSCLSLFCSHPPSANGPRLHKMENGLYFLKKAKEYRKYTMTIQVADALVLFRQCWIIFKDGGVADELELLARGDLILFITVHALLPVGAVLFWIPAVPLEATGALKGGLEWRLWLIARLFGWHSEMYKPCTCGFASSYFLKCSVMHSGRFSPQLM